MSNTEDFHLSNAPIVEAILDIECAVSSFNSDRTQEVLFERLKDKYPISRKRFAQLHRVRAKAHAPVDVKVENSVQALMYLKADEKEIVQVRPQGYSFNRLAPYDNLDSYLPEIERTWKLFVEICQPIEVREVKLRYINKIMLPLNEAGTVTLNEYLRLCPQLADQEKLTFAGFLHQHVAVEKATGNIATTVLTSQEAGGGYLPIVLDNAVASSFSTVTTDWQIIKAKITQLRSLKNLIFRNTLTAKCLSLFQQSVS